MSVLMMTLIYGAVVLTLEKRSGMLRRQSALPFGRIPLFAGKLAGRFLVALAQIVLLLAAGSLLFHISWGRSPGGLALVLLSYAAAVASLSTLLGAVVRTPDQASAVGWIGSLALAGLGGCWWPAEVMPSWLRLAAHALPTTWAMDSFHILISFGRGAAAVLPGTAVLLGFTLLFAALGARFLKPG